MILPVDADADRLAHHPVIRERLGKRRIHLESRRLDESVLRLRFGRTFQRLLQNAKRHERHDKAAADEEIPTGGHRSSLIRCAWGPIPTRSLRSRLRAAP